MVKEEKNGECKEYYENDVIHEIRNYKNVKKYKEIVQRKINFNV